MERNETTRIKLPKMFTHLDQQRLLQHTTSRCVSTIIKPLRIFQFFAMLLLFTFTIYMIAMDPIPISTLACILLIVLSGVHVFVLAVELISHFAGGALHIIPMVIFSSLGLLFFGVAGILLILNAYTQPTQIIATTLCLLAALLFLIDITMVLAFWKRRCSVCKQCCNYVATEPLRHKDEKIMTHDVTTSVSDIRVPRELQGIAMLDHSYRKVGYPRRREYVDCPTCVPSLCSLDVAQIQTEPKKISVVESQTPCAEMKETPMQTLSKCEFCHQQIQLPLAEGAGMPGAHYFQHPLQQWSYPAVVQFVREGTNAPCCPGCKCATGTVQTQQRRQQQLQQLAQHARLLTTKAKTSSGKMTSTEIERDNVTRLTTTQLITAGNTPSFYEPDKRVQIVPETALGYKRKMDAIKMKEDANPRESVDRMFAEETEAPLAKELETVDEAMSEDGKERSIEPSEVEIGESGKVERSKGGGEDYARIYQELMRAMERGSVTNLEESSVHARRLFTPPSSRAKPRALLYLKSNKVDPIKDANVFDEDCIPEEIESRTALEDNQAAQQSKHPARIGSPNPATEHQLNDTCSLCRRQSLTPTSDNSRCYVIFKDKKGRYFCEFCAPLDSEKITSRLEGMDLRKLRCAICRLNFRERGISRTNVKLKSDARWKCGRSQRHATSPSST